jgi:hypothetical protein
MGRAKTNQSGKPLCPAPHVPGGSNPDFPLGPHVRFRQVRHWSRRAVRWSTCAILLKQTGCLPCNCNHGFFPYQISSISSIATVSRSPPSTCARQRIPSPVVPRITVETMPPACVLRRGIRSWKCEKLSALIDC